MGQLGNKIAIVTGAGSGIGRAIAASGVALMLLVLGCAADEPSGTSIFEPTITIGDGWRLTIDTEHEAIFEPAGNETPDGTIAFMYLRRVFDPSDLRSTEDAPSDTREWIGSHPRLRVLDELRVMFGGFAGIRLQVESDLSGFPLVATSVEDYRIRFNGQAVIYLMSVQGREMFIYLAPRDPRLSMEFLETAETAVVFAGYGER